MIGIDLIKTSRMENIIKKFGDKALKRFLDDREISLVKNFKTAAGFWAVKEASSKALGVGIGKECSFYDISIFKTKKGAPYIQFSEKIQNKFKVIDTSVSITHDGEYAIAVVAIETKSSTTNKI